MKHRGTLVVLILLLTGFGGSLGLAAQKTQVFVTLPPQAFLAERIIGEEGAEVHTLIDKGQDPHTFEPTPRQATALAKADLFFSVDLPFEKPLVAKAVANNRDLKVVDSTMGVTRLAMVEHHHDGHAGEHHTDAHHDNHGGQPGHDAGQGEPDPHVWLAPANLTIMARNMATAMEAIMPDRKEALRRNLKTLLDELDALDKRLAISLAPFRGQTFYVFHPAFGYFAQAYGLTQEAVETGGKSPSPKQIKELIGTAKDDGVKVIFVQPQFDTKSATTVAQAIGGTVTPIDSMARDVPRNLEAIASAIGKALQLQGKSVTHGGKP